MFKTAFRTIFFITEFHEIYCIYFISRKFSWNCPNFRKSGNTITLKSRMFSVLFSRPIYSIESALQVGQGSYGSFSMFIDTGCFREGTLGFNRHSNNVRTCPPPPTMKEQPLPKAVRMIFFHKWTTCPKFLRGMVKKKSAGKI